jgi:hypothetical protein
MFPAGRGEDGEAPMMDKRTSGATTIHQPLAGTSMPMSKLRRIFGRDGEWRVMERI